MICEDHEFGVHYCTSTIVREDSNTIALLKYESNPNKDVTQTEHLRLNFELDRMIAKCLKKKKSSQILHLSQFIIQHLQPLKGSAEEDFK